MPQDNQWNDKSVHQLSSIANHQFDITGSFQLLSLENVNGSNSTSSSKKPFLRYEPTVDFNTESPFPQVSELTSAQLSEFYRLFWNQVVDGWI